MLRIKKILPLSWWICLFVFLIHQVLEKILDVRIPFLDSYLDPFLAMPILLGIHLAERRIIFRQGPSFVLPVFEIVVIGIFAAIIFEEGLPRWFDGFVRDSWDYVGYGAGVVFFLMFINKRSDAI